MDYYKPNQDNLHFVYNRLSKNVCIKSDVTVRLKEKESLTRPLTGYDPVTKKVMKLYDHARDDSQLVPYDYMDDTPVEIIKLVSIPYNDQDQPAFRTRLRQILAANYEVSAKVNNKPNTTDTGGQSTNTISNNDPIDIL